MEDYYDKFLQPCAIIPRQLYDIYLREAFKEGLQTKMKMTIINMPRRTLTKVAESVILIEEELLVRWKNMAKYHPNNFDSDESENNDDEHEHYEKKTKKKSKKMNIDTIKEGVYYQNCFNEGHFTKECKLLMKFYQIYKANDHNTHQCPSKAVSGSCPSTKIILVHVV
jgi:hypothetical protein